MQAGGEAAVYEAVSRAISALFTSAQQAIHLAIPTLEGEGRRWRSVSPASWPGELAFAEKGVGINALQGKIDAQVKRGELLSIAVAPGVGAICWSRGRALRRKKALSGGLPKARTACRTLAQRLCLATTQDQVLRALHPN